VKARHWLVHDLARVAPVVACGLLCTLVWALDARFDYWEARPFVLLFYGAGCAAAIGTVCVYLLRSRPGALPGRAITTLRRLAWIGVMLEWHGHGIRAPGCWWRTACDSCRCSVCAERQQAPRGSCRRFAERPVDVPDRTNPRQLDAHDSVYLP